MMDPSDKHALFAGIFPCGIVYADRRCEIDGDYATCAFLFYRTLALEFDASCPDDLRPYIEADAALIQVRRGEDFQVSACGQTVRLGEQVRQ